MSNPEVTDFRVGELEKDTTAIKNNIEKINDKINVLTSVGNQNTKSLDRIESVVKWSFGGLISALFAALGKFFLSGKLNP